MKILILFCIGLIFHELGHYVAAVWCGVGVKKCCLFFDPWFHLWSSGNRFKTEFCLGWIPFGAYVLFKSPDGNDAPSKDCLMAKSLWTQMGVYAAGIAVNLILAFCCTFAYVAEYINQDNRKTVTECASFSAHLLEQKSKSFYLSIGNDFKGRETKKYVAQECRKQFVQKNEHRRILWQFAQANLFLFLFNILPVLPLDGGKILLCGYKLCRKKNINKNVEWVMTSIGLFAILTLIVAEFVHLILRF